MVCRRKDVKLAIRGKGAPFQSILFYFGLARACDSAASQAVQPVLSFEEATGLVHRRSNLVWQVRISLYFPQFSQKYLQIK